MHLTKGFGNFTLGQAVVGGAAGHPPLRLQELRRPMHLQQRLVGGLDPPVDQLAIAADGTASSLAELSYKALASLFQAAKTTAW